MTAQMPFERMVADWMADEAAGASGQALERILMTTARARPRPRWWAQLAEPPMRSRAMRTAVGLPNRRLVLAVTLGLLAVALAALAIVGGLVRLPPAEADWSGFRGNADRSGVAAVGPKGNPVNAWRFQAGGGVLEVAVVGDRVFFVSDDGRVHALSRDHGVEQWTASLPDAPLVGPYAADGRLYVSDSRGRLHALGQADGHEIWTSASTYAAPTRAISAEGSIYFGTDDGFVVALAAATGTELWRVQPPGATHVDAPAFASGVVYAGTDGSGFAAIDARDHAVRWTGDTHGEDTGTATVIDGIAYIGAAPEPNAGGTLHAFDALTGRLLWTAGDSDLGLPTAADGVTYTTSIGGLLEAIDTATGAARWRVQLAGDLRSPVVVGGVVYVTAGSEHRIYAVDATTGGELWHYDLDALANCCVSVASGSLFVGTQSGSVYALAGDGATIVARPFPSLATAVPTSPTSSAASSPTSVPSSAVSPSPAASSSVAAVTWSTDLRGKGFAPISQIAVDPTGRIWAPEPGNGRIAIFRPDGSLLEEWGEPGSGRGQFDFVRGNGDAYGTLAFAKDGSFYVLDVGNRRIQHFDAKRRYVGEWGELGNGPGQFTDPVGIAVDADATVWVLDDVRSVVEHSSSDGTVLGSFDPFSNAPSNQGANSLAIDHEGHLYVTQISPNQVAEFGPDGRLLQTIGAGRFASQPTHMAIDDEGRLFVTQGADPGVLVFGPDGTFLGGFGRVEPGDDQLVFPAGIALDGSGGVYVEDCLPDSARLVRFGLRPPLAP